MTARLLVVQPSEVAPVERLGEWLAGTGADLVLRRPTSDGVPESLEGVDGVVCIGGEMSAQDDVDHPWLAALRQATQAFRVGVGDRRALPLLGH